MRKQKKREVSSIDLDCDTLGQALSRIKELIEAYGEDADIKKTVDGYSDYEYLGVFIMEDETDAEMEYRENLEAKQKKQQEERDAREFERLKQKFNK